MYKIGIMAHIFRTILISFIFVGCPQNPPEFLPIDNPFAGSITRADFNPNWSPDGSMILFTRYDGSIDISKNGIYSIDPSGTSLRFFYTGYEAVWSNDGEEILICGVEKQESSSRCVIYRTHKELTEWRKIIDDGISPAWSPSKEYVIYCSLKEVGVNYPHKIVNLSSDKEFSVLWTQLPARISFHSEGDKFIYSFLPGYGSDIYSMKMEFGVDSVYVSSNNKMITHGGYAVYSRIGDGIAFVFPDTMRFDSLCLGYFQVNSGKIDTLSDAEAVNPSISPDGQKIVFGKRTGDEIHLWISDKNSKNLYQLTK